MPQHYDSSGTPVTALPEMVATLTRQPGRKPPDPEARLERERVVEGGQGDLFSDQPTH